MHITFAADVFSIQSVFLLMNQSQLLKEWWKQEKYCREEGERTSYGLAKFAF